MAFVALHNIRPVIEEFPFSEQGLTKAFEKLDKGQIRYRGVLKIA